MNNFTPDILQKIFSKINHPIPIYLTHDGAGNPIDNIKRPVLGYAYKFGLHMQGNKILFQAFLMDPASKQLVALSGYDCTSAEVDVVQDDQNGTIRDATLMGIAAVPVPAISGTNLEMKTIKLSAPDQSSPAKPTKRVASSKGTSEDTEKVLDDNETAIQTKPMGGEHISAITSFGDRMSYKPDHATLQQTLLGKGFSADETIAFLEASKVLFSGCAYDGPTGAPRSTATNKVTQSYSDAGSNTSEPVTAFVADANPTGEGHVVALPGTQMDEQNTQVKGFALERQKFQAEITTLKGQLSDVTTKFEALLAKEVATEVNAVKSLGFANPEGMIADLPPSQQLVVLARLKENFAMKAPATGVTAGTSQGNNFALDQARADVLLEFGDIGQKLMNAGTQVTKQ